MAMMLLSASVTTFSVSCMQDLKKKLYIYFLCLKKIQIKLKHFCKLTTFKVIKEFEGGCCEVISCGIICPVVSRHT